MQRSRRSAYTFFPLAHSSSAFRSGAAVAARGFARRWFRATLRPRRRKKRSSATTYVRVSRPWIYACSSSLRSHAVHVPVACEHLLNTRSPCLPLGGRMRRRPAGWASQWVPLYGHAAVTRAGEVEEPTQPTAHRPEIAVRCPETRGVPGERKIRRAQSAGTVRAGVEVSRSPYRNSPARFDATQGCSSFTANCVKGSTESLTRRERLDAVKARVEAKRSQYGGSSSSDDEEDVTWRENSKESKAYQEPNNMVRRAGAVTPLTVTTTFQGPAAPVQPSPQDSGVSSQSVASSPSLGRAPTPPPRRTPSRALTRESSLLASKPRRHSASFEQWRMEDSGIGSERKDSSSFYSYADLTPAHGVKARVRGPAYSYTDQAPVRPDSAGAYMSDPQRTDMRFFGLAPGHRRASISAESRIREVFPPPVPRQRPVTGNTSSLEAARRRLDDVIQRERDRRSSANLETALNELEEIYNSLRLNEDEDLLFRAERRDLPTKFQLNRPGADTVLPEVAYPLKRSCSDDMSFITGLRQRAPSFRRSAIPDKVADDLANRRLAQPQPPARNGAHTPPPRKDVSYMLCSAAFTPSLHVHPALMDVSLAGEPDIEKDDMCYRNYTQADALRVPPPHPPFGIPLVPTQGTACDYIRARPPDAPRPLTRPKVHPDLVRDDMAFRNLRKDPAVSLAARRATRALSVSVGFKSTSPSDKQHDKSQSMTSIMEALQKESQRWKRLDEGVTHAPSSSPGANNHVPNNGPDWSAARQRGKIVPMEDCQLDALLASLTPPPVPTPGERRLRTGVRIPA
ncbi:hypothetical protein MRX96_027154 [Rhipicephalus microplus]